MQLSKKIIRHFQAISYWADGLEKATTCWRAKEAAGIEFTEEERAQLNEAYRKFNEAKRLVSGIYSKRIGDAVVAEIRDGQAVLK